MARKKVSKSQWIRLLDIPLGLFMIWFGIIAQEVPEIARWIMIISGIGTIVYNGRNYLRNRNII